MERIGTQNRRNEIEVTRLSDYIGELVTLHGSIYKIRKMSGFSFVILRTARYTVQCVCDRQEVLGQLQEEACVELTAEVVKEERAKAGAELHITEVYVLSRPTAQMPIVMNQKLIEASLENKLDYRPLTLRNEKERAVFKIQEGLLRGIRHFLQAEGFTEIHSPKIVYAGAEGGANIFKLDYFGKEAYLAQSPQFYKQMMVGVFERVFEVGPVFRAEKHDTARHLNEYTGVDFEMGYIHSFREIMETETRMLQAAFELLREEYAYELELLKVQLPCGVRKAGEKGNASELLHQGCAGAVGFE
ncbi:MAG: aspartate--tRNA(Asn) ligase, partial [Acetatifactor sp.]|nr:aspartate--tRNA(Asn) ligase [Acetatifactor sp.]